MKVRTQVKLKIQRGQLDQLYAKGWGDFEMKKIMLREKNYGASDEEIVNALLKWDKKDAIRGYCIVSSKENPETKVVKRIEDFRVFDTDEEAATQASKDGFTISEQNGEFVCVKFDK